MAQPSFLSKGDQPRRTDTRWFEWTRILGQYQNLPGADPANNPKRTDSLRQIMLKVLKAVQ